MLCVECAAVLAQVHFWCDYFAYCTLRICLFFIYFIVLILSPSVIQFYYLLVRYFYSSSSEFNTELNTFTN
jgi:hypothetical protein